MKNLPWMVLQVSHPDTYSRLVFRVQLFLPELTIDTEGAAATNYQLNMFYPKRAISARWLPDWHLNQYNE